MGHTVKYGREDDFPPIADSPPSQLGSRLMASQPAESGRAKSGWDHLYAVDTEALRQVRERKPWAEGQGVAK